MDFKTFLENLNEQITCNICEEIFEQPKMLLPCMHTVCVDCLNRMADRAKQGRRNAIRCPMCNANIPIPQPEGNFSSLPNNFYIQRLKDMAIIRDAGTQQIKCGNCERKSTDTSYCFDCCGFWCTICEAAHKIVREYRDHRLLALRDFNDDDLGAMLQRPAFCQEQYHKNEPLRYFCNDCERCICQVCVVLTHKSHHIQLMEEVARLNENTIVEQIHKAKENFQELISEIKKAVQERKTLVQKNLETVKADIRNAVERVIASLREQERDLAVEMEELVERSQNRLNNQMKSVSSHIENLQHVTRTAEGVVQRKSTLEILVTKNVLCKRLNELNQTNVQIHPKALAVVKGKFIPCEVIATLNLGRIEKEENSSCVGGKERDVSANPSCAMQAAALEFVPVKVIGKKGGGNGEFDRPYSVAENVELNEMAVTDTNNKRVQIFDLDGHYLRQFGQEGSGQGMFKFATGVIYDKQNNIVVADNTNHTVSIFTREGRFLRYLATEGNQDGQVRGPWNLSVTDEGNIIVADRGNKRIQVFAPDGRLVVKFGDTGNGQLQGPAACVYHRDHYIVTDFDSKCIRMYDMRGQYVKTLILHRGNERKPITDIRPLGITSTNCGNIITADVMNHRLVMFRLDGSVIATFGSKGSGLGQFNCPSDVSVLGDKQIIVCEPGSNRLQVLHHP